MKILIADDQEDERNNHVVIEVDDGTWAIKAFRDDPAIDLVITDLKMMHKSGLDVIVGVKAIRKDARVWLVSNALRPKTEREPGTFEEATALGAEKVLEKIFLGLELRDSGIIRAAR